jgi:hypothetical protein
MVSDVLYWFAFFGGQFLFMLKRADLAVRSPLNAVESKSHFFAYNWVPLTIRTFIEFGFIFAPWRSIGTDGMMALFGWHVPFPVPHGWVAASILGYLSDSMMDWAAMQKKILGITVPDIIKETIPQLAVVTQIVAVIKEQNGKDQEA